MNESNNNSGNIQVGNSDNANWWENPNDSLLKKEPVNIDTQNAPEVQSAQASQPVSTVSVTQMNTSVATPNVAQAATSQMNTSVVTPNAAPAHPQIETASQGVNSGIGASAKSITSQLQKKKDEEDLVQSFVGINYDKLSSGGFNFCAFFFGGVYYLYRKMYVLFLVVVLVEGMITAFVSNSAIIVFIFDILVALSFNTLYMGHAKTKVNEIINSGVEKPREVCIRKGGTNFIPVLVLVVIPVVLFLFFPAIGGSNGKVTFNEGSSTRKEALTDAYNYILALNTSMYNYVRANGEDVFHEGKIELGKIPSSGSHAVTYVPSEKNGEKIELKVNYSGPNPTSGTFYVEEATVIDVKNFRLNGYTFTVDNGYLK